MINEKSRYELFRDFCEGNLPGISGRRYHALDAMQAYEIYEATQRHKAATEEKTNE